MIDSQLRTSGVNEAFVIEAMGAIPREDHVPETARANAYVDRAIALGDGRFLAAPLFHGRLLAEAKPTADDRVLVVDGGSGYLPALVRTLCSDVTVIDPAEAVAKSRKKGGFTLVLIDGAIEQWPDALSARLADDARIVTGLVERGVQRLAVGRKLDGAVSFLNLAEMGIPSLAAFAAPKTWSFDA